MVKRSKPITLLAAAIDAARSASLSAAWRGSATRGALALQDLRSCRYPYVSSALVGPNARFFLVAIELQWFEAERDDQAAQQQAGRARRAVFNSGAMAVLLVGLANELELSPAHQHDGLLEIGRMHGEQLWLPIAAQLQAELAHAERAGVPIVAAGWASI
jgi:hypothetical protein